MSGRILIGVIVIAVVVVALMLGQGNTRRSVIQASADVPVESPGYSARDAEVVETGKDGRPIYTLNARTVRQQPNDHRVQLDAPRMTFVASDGSRWNLAARSGQIHADGANVDLFGDVRMDGQVSERPIHIATSVISFDTQTEVASTAAPVTFDSNGNRIASRGLVANLKDGTVTLESRFHGTFPPRQRR